MRAQKMREEAAEKERDEVQKLDCLVSETGGSRIFRTSDKTSKTTMAGPDDWRTPLVRYLENPGHIADRKVWR
jgi:hypothetical protein